MEDSQRYKQIVQQLAAQEKEFHTENEKRIRAGMQCLVWIPMIFLILLFLTESAKVIFLILWIISLFLISAYLIYVEYIDFQAQERLLQYQEDAKAENSSLIGGEIEDLEERMLELLRQIDEKKAENRRQILLRLEKQQEKLGENSSDGPTHLLRRP